MGEENSNASSQIYGGSNSLWSLIVNQGFLTMGEERPNASRHIGGTTSIWSLIVKTGLDKDL